jgi:large subunit ribosomal protein L22
MANTVKKTRHAENEAIAIARHIRGSERKLNLLAQLIRGKSAARALVELEFSRKRMAKDVKKVLESAIANAENNQNLDIDRLYVKEATVGRTVTMKRFSARARGRSASIEKPFANITIIVKEKDEAEVKAKKAPKATTAATEAKATEAKSAPKAKKVKTETKEKAGE